MASFELKAASLSRLALGVAGLLASVAVLGGLAFAPTAQAKFGLAPGSFLTTALNEDGTIDRQAGSHPYEYMVSFSLNLDEEGKVEDNARDIYVELPPGLVGNPTAVPRCTRQEFEGLTPRCSGDTQVGFLHGDIEGLGGQVEGPIFNLVPPNGKPASFGFSAAGKDVFIDANVRTGGDDGITAASNNIPSTGVTNVAVTIWGVPAAESHTDERECIVEHSGGTLERTHCKSGVSPKPFLTLPASCNGPLQTGIKMDSLEAPEELVSGEPALSRDGGGNPAGLLGCEKLSFEPSLTLAPDTTSADSPAGLTAEVKLNQSSLETVQGLSAADVKNATVTLPAGVSVNPGQAAGLAACQIPESGIGTENPPACPAASKVGTVKVKTPLLEEELEGNIYVLPPNPPNLQLLVTAVDVTDGIYVKLVGRVHLDEATGQLTTSFGENQQVEEEDPALRGHLLVPQLPVSSFRLTFSGGEKAALVTPAQCGLYPSIADFTPWSTPSTPDAFPTSTFAVTSGPAGGPCPAGALPFTPSMVAGSTTDQAGSYTGFSLLLQRADDQQRVEKLQFTAPKGLLGFLSHVTLCPEPQAQQGACPVSSLIGHTTVEAGPGPYPLVVPEPGRPQAPIYLTGPYRGAPFGLSIAVPLTVGPFDLGTIVTRGTIAVNRRTTQLTITTDPLPQIVDGVPTDLRTIVAEIDKPEFMINPTNCETMSFAGAAYSSAGATGALSTPFGVGSCRSLTFSPHFTATALGKVTKADGTSLTLKLTRPTGPGSEQANFSSAKLNLPKQLPSRLTTLQKACTAAQFEANPAGCPAASVIGRVRVLTPVLPVPLEGPAYFVSHGGEAFPNLVFVLQGYGVTIEAIATTFISKAGVTTGTLKEIPDAPFSSFELTLPAGPDSVLTGLGSLCAPTNTATVAKKVTVKVRGRKKAVTRAVKVAQPTSLSMPTEFVAQNGLVLDRTTTVGVTGCPKAVSHVRVKKRAKKK